MELVFMWTPTSDANAPPASSTRGARVTVLRFPVAPLGFLLHRCAHHRPLAPRELGGKDDCIRHELVLLCGS